MVRLEGIRHILQVLNRLRCQLKTNPSFNSQIRELRFSRGIFAPFFRTLRSSSEHGSFANCPISTFVVQSFDWISGIGNVWEARGKRRLLSFGPSGMSPCGYSWRLADWCLSPCGCTLESLSDLKHAPAFARGRSANNLLTAGPNKSHVLKLWGRQSISSSYICVFSFECACRLYFTRAVGLFSAAALLWAHTPRQEPDVYLSQVSSLTVLHRQQRQVVDGYHLMHSLRNISGCNDVDVVQPTRVKKSGNRSEPRIPSHLFQWGQKTIKRKLSQSKSGPVVPRVYGIGTKWNEAISTPPPPGSEEFTSSLVIVFLVLFEGPSKAWRLKRSSNLVVQHVAVTSSLHPFHVCVGTWHTWHINSLVTAKKHVLKMDFNYMRKQFTGQTFPSPPLPSDLLRYLLSFLIFAVS